MSDDSVYVSRCARDAQRTHGKSYCDYLERSAIEHHAYFLARGDTEMAEKMLTQSLGEALQGNKGD